MHPDGCQYWVWGLIGYCKQSHLHPTVKLSSTVHKCRLSACTVCMSWHYVCLSSTVWMAMQGDWGLLACWRIRHHPIAHKICTAQTLCLTLCQYFMTYINILITSYTVMGFTYCFSRKNMIPSKACTVVPDRQHDNSHDDRMAMQCHSTSGDKSPKDLAPLTGTYHFGYMPSWSSTV